MKHLFALLATLILCGCAGIWGGVVTVTQVRDSAMTELAALHKAGRISVATDAKIAAADLKYRQAAELAAVTLQASKATGDKSQYLAALEATKTAALGILEILSPLITQQKAVNLQTQLLQAQTL